MLRDNEKTEKTQNKTHLRETVQSNKQLTRAQLVEIYRTEENHLSEKSGSSAFVVPRVVHTTETQSFSNAT